MREFTQQMVDSIFSFAELGFQELETHRYQVEILKKNNKVFESKSYPGEPHGFRNPANRVDMYRRLEAFFDKYLRNQS